VDRLLRTVELTRRHTQWLEPEYRRKVMSLPWRCVGSMLNAADGLRPRRRVKGQKEELGALHSMRCAITGVANN
jgi:hypothetical protein